MSGTRNLVAGFEHAEPRPAVLVSPSAAGYYGDRGDELLDENAAPGSDFLAGLCVDWEEAADASLGPRGARRQGQNRDRARPHGGALARMLLPFRLGVGGPIASGRQYIPWIALEDLVGIYVAALDGDDWSGAVNGCAPEPVPQREFARALGRALHRPAVLPVPPIALRVLFGELADSLTGGQRMVPSRTLALGYEFHYPELGRALEAVLA